MISRVLPRGVAPTAIDHQRRRQPTAETGRRSLFLAPQEPLERARSLTPWVISSVVRSAPAPLALLACDCCSTGAGHGWGDRDAGLLDGVRSAPMEVSRLPWSDERPGLDVEWLPGGPEVGPVDFGDGGPGCGYPGGGCERESAGPFGSAVGWSRWTSSQSLPAAGEVRSSRLIGVLGVTGGSAEDAACVTGHVASFARRRASRRRSARLAFSFLFATTRLVASRVRTKARSRTRTAPRP